MGLHFLWKTLYLSTSDASLSLKHCTIDCRRSLAFSQALQKCRAVAVSYSWALDLLLLKTMSTRAQVWSCLPSSCLWIVLCVEVFNYNSQKKLQLSNFNKESNSYSSHIRLNLILVFGSQCAELEPFFTLWNMLHYAGHQDYMQLIT